MGVANPLNFLGVFLAAFDDAPFGIAVDANTGADHHFGEDHGERAIDGDFADVFTAQEFGDALSGSGFAIAGETTFGGEIFWASDGIDAGGLTSPVHFDIAEDEGGAEVGAGRDFDEGDGVSDEEANTTIEASVESRDAGHDTGHGSCHDELSEGLK